ncbi:hypothetical protein [Spirosoma sp.]|uniref:hypothetical protein n=1 Tax=Spirosoma sp. TaxID=1899569 RepID=UPI00260A51A5|nr:hypothetical protein [Spirosoma sp.]MCX6214675.1 hypothetical protein [Spirosoma sp.]
MENTPPIDVLLENYILNIGARYIALISPEAQTSLMNLVNQVGKFPSDACPPAYAPLESPGKLLINSSFGYLERQWQEALASSPVKEPCSTESSRMLFQRALLVNQREIEATLSCIKQMDKLIARAETTRHRSNQQDELIGHYRSVRGSFIIRLEQLKSFRERRIGSRFASSEID